MSVKCSTMSIEDEVNEWKVKMYASPYLYKIPEKRIQTKRQEIEFKKCVVSDTLIDKVCAWTPCVCAIILVGLFIGHRMTGGTVAEFADAVYQGLTV